MNRKLLFATIAAVTIVAGALQWVQADIGSTAGQMVQVAAPPSVQFGVLVDNARILVFEEQQFVTLISPLAVDFTAPGLYDEPGDLTPASLDPGPTVCSHLIHFDTVGSTTASSSGSVTFNNNVIGVMLMDARLNASDALLGATGTQYPAGLNGRGLELAMNSDRIALSANQRTVTVGVNASTATDQARVITECDPLPPGTGEWVYSVKYACGVVRQTLLADTTLTPGMYATDINISNPAAIAADLSKRIIPLRGELFPTTREPQFQSSQATDGMMLPAMSATMDDCFRIVELLYGPGQFPTLDSLPLELGFFEIRSPEPVDVVAVYTTSIDTATGMLAETPAIHVERIEGRLLD